MRCPRCYTLLEDDVTNCPDCDLPKPKAEPVRAEPVREKPATAEQVLCDAEEPASVSIIRNPPSKTVKQPQRPVKNPPAETRGLGRKPSRYRMKPVVTALVLAATIAVCGVMSFPVVKSFIVTNEFDPHTARVALDKVRRLPSSQPGVTVSDRLKSELERSRKAGDLVSYRGWTVEPVKGSKEKVLVVFSYEEKGNLQYRAEWLADVSNDKFTPQTELAVEVSRKENK